MCRRLRVGPTAFGSSPAPHRLPPLRRLAGPFAQLVAEALQAAGLGEEAGASVHRVQHALAAGGGSAQAADELAGLLSLISLQARACALRRSANAAPACVPCSPLLTS